MQRPAGLRGEERQKRSLGLGLNKVLAIARGIVDTTAKLTWVTAGYGWVSIVAPIDIASARILQHQAVLRRTDGCGWRILSG